MGFWIISLAENDKIYDEILSLLLENKRGTAKSTFICEGSRKTAPNGPQTPQLHMEGANGIRFPGEKNLKPYGL